MGVHYSKAKDAYVFEVKNGSYRKIMTFSVKKYGIYAKLMAEYAQKTYEETGTPVKLLNWFDRTAENDIQLYFYRESEDQYYKILISEEDYDKIKDYYWSAKKGHATYYASTEKGNSKTDCKKQIYMHRLLENILDNPELVVDHKNGNGLDNRRQNLRSVTLAENNTNRITPNKQNNTGIPGVNRNKQDTGWRVQYQESKNKTKIKTFSDEDYDGKENAFNEAVSYRRLKEKEHNYLSARD